MAGHVPMVKIIRPPCTRKNFQVFGQTLFSQNANIGILAKWSAKVLWGKPNRFDSL